MSITLSFEVNDDIPPVELTSSDWRVTNSEGSHTLAPEDERFTFSLDFTSLTIDDVHVYDEGVYTLTASNEAGSGSASITVDVQCKTYVYTVLYSRVHFSMQGICMHLLESKVFMNTEQRSKES